MKNLLFTLLLVSPMVGATPEIKEVYTQLDETVQIVLTNAPCTKWEAPPYVQLNHAYAVNTKTGDRVVGCFTHEGDIIHIELVDEKNFFYSYKIHADKFILRPTL